jgi:hypothetical protein
MILRKIIGLLALMVLISMVSGAQVNDVTGPFKVSFELPVDKATTDVPAPASADTLTMYGLSTSADKWFINIVITRYINSHEIDLDAIRRSVAAGAGVDKSQASSRAIDGKSAVYAIKETNSGTTLDAVYWLDATDGYGTEMVEVMIASNEAADATENVLDTLKIK